MIIKKIWNKLDLPAGVTLLNLISGFIAILFAIDGNYFYAAIMIFLSAIFDSLDGRIARLLNRTSSFGVELDSLADAVSFVLAPTIILYLRNLKEFGYFGFAVCAAILCFGVIRLARFNLKEIPDYFEGLPVPAYGILVALFTISGAQVVSELQAIMFAIVGFLMISKIPYPNFKKGVRGVFEFIILSMLISTLLYPLLKLNFLLVIVLIYIILGPAVESLKLKRKKK